MQTVIAEARAILNANPSTPGPFTLFMIDRLFGEKAGADGLPAFQDRDYAPGHYIVEPGEVPNRIFAVTRGIAMLESPEGAAGEYVARLLRPDEVVGFVETLTLRPLRYGLVASTDCIVRSICRKELLRYIADHPETRSRVISLLAESVRDADRFLKNL